MAAFLGRFPAGGAGAGRAAGPGFRLSGGGPTRVLVCGTVGDLLSGCAGAGGGFPAAATGCVAGTDGAAC